MLRPNKLAKLAEAYLAANRFDEGLSALTEALAVAESTRNFATCRNSIDSEVSCCFKQNGSNTGEAAAELFRAGN